MKVLKFGGTSVGSVDNMKSVMQIITDGERKVVVLSAMSGTTNTLVEISELLYKKKQKEATKLIDKLEAKYNKVISQLYASADYKQKGAKHVKQVFETLKSYTTGEFDENGEKAILAQGEMMSTGMFHFLLLENGFKSALIPALDFMKIDEELQPDLKYITEHIEPIMADVADADYVITQGYICLNADNNVDNLQRGGSDYTATLIGAAINSEIVEIWTDIDGFHNNDPRYVENTAKINQLSFEEAAELAFFGAKILHPSTILPCKKRNVPVRLKNTMNPTDDGTLITHDPQGKGIKAIAAKDNIAAIKIKSDRMLNAHGFLRKVFEIFENFKTPIDMITTSEVAVSCTIDKMDYLEDILVDLESLGEVSIDTDQTIICIVGHDLIEEKGHQYRIFKALEKLPIRMISYGGSNHNISILTCREDKKEALNALSKGLF
ncbi:aspartate kinase [Prolixibacteraceae bacterium JC049]|nr:aspartate kinase [Prolixibacteraceae bacterium JC049]